MCPINVYSKLMIADIKMPRLSRPPLPSSPDYLPALRGLAETYIVQAVVFLQEFVDKLCGAMLTRAAQLRPGLAGIWRLLGEACSQ